MTFRISLKLLILLIFFVFQNGGYAQTEILNWPGFSAKKQSPVSNFYALSAPQMYIVGKSRGSYENIGKDKKFHYSGIWNTPVKLMNGLYYEVFEVSEHPQEPEDFKNLEQRNGLIETNKGYSTLEHKFYLANFKSKNEEGLHVVRQDFLAEEKPAYFTSITLNHQQREEEQSSTRKLLTLRIRLDVDIEPGQHVRNEIQNTDDQLEFNDEQEYFFAFDKASKHGFSFKGSERPSFKHINPQTQQMWMYFNLALETGNRKAYHFTVLADNLHGYKKTKESILETHNSRAASLRTKREKYQERITNGVRFSSSEESLNFAFLSAKANALMSWVDFSTLGVPSPNPHGYFASSLPIYTQLFGNDLGLSIPGLLRAGFISEVKSTLESLIHYSGVFNLTPHQVSETGRVITTRRTQTTLQLIHAIWEYYLFTLDLDFLRENYEKLVIFFNNNIEWYDRDDDLYLVGYSIGESEHIKGHKRMGAAAYMYAALKSLEKIAESLNYSYDKNYFSLMATDYKKRFNQDWWMKIENQESSRIQSNFASSLLDSGDADEERFWVSALPSYLNLAEKSLANQSLLDFQDNWSSPYGVISRFLNESLLSKGIGINANNVISSAAFKNKKPELGTALLRASARVSYEYGMPGFFGACQPQICDNPLQLWSVGTFLEAFVGGLLGVNPTGASELTLSPFLPGNMSFFEIENLEVQKSTLYFKWKRTESKNLLELKRSNAKPIKFRIEIPPSVYRPVYLNGLLKKSKSFEVTL